VNNVETQSKNDHKNNRRDYNNNRVYSIKNYDPSRNSHRQYYQNNEYNNNGYNNSPPAVHNNRSQICNMISNETQTEYLKKTQVPVIIANTNSETLNQVQQTIMQN
jgi:hypothetical protein